jgi:DNA-binding MarR family transcriptional regulator
VHTSQTGSNLDPDGAATDADRDSNPSPEQGSLDPLSTDIAVTLFGLSARLTSFSQAFSELHGVSSPSAFNVMTIIDGAGEALPPSVIAERMIVSRPTITGVVDTLVRRGQVRVLKHPGDGRRALVELTAAGRHVVQRMGRELHRVEREWMSCLSLHERETLLALLVKVQDNMPEV